MRRSNLALAFYLVLVFLSGAVVGAFGYRLYVGANSRTQRLSPEEYRQRYVEAMKKRLQLSDDQVQQLNVILDRTRDRFRRLDNEVMKPQKQAIRNQQIQDITAMLDSEQRAEYEKWRQERAERRKAAGEHGRPPRRPH